MNEGFSHSEVGESGDVYTVHDCDECDGLVVSHYLTCSPGVRPSEAHADPHAVVDIPPELAEWFRRVVNEWADAVQAREQEDEL